MQSTCTICHQVKPIEDFVKSKRLPSGYCNRCKDCQKTISKDHYYRDPKKANKKVLIARRKKVERFNEFKKGLKCEECGMSEWYCLEFHHNDSEQKRMDVTKMVQNGMSWQNIMIEAQKCKVLCANCHRRHHWQQKQEVFDLVKV